MCKQIDELKQESRVQDREITLQSLKTLELKKDKVRIKEMESQLIAFDVDPEEVLDLLKAEGRTISKANRADDPEELLQKASHSRKKDSFLEDPVDSDDNEESTTSSRQ